MKAVNLLFPELQQGAFYRKAANLVDARVLEASFIEALQGEIDS